MGFGKSETPQDRTYDASEHIVNLESLLVDTLDLTDITLVRPHRHRVRAASPRPATPPIWSTRATQGITEVAHEGTTG